MIDSYHALGTRLKSMHEDLREFARMISKMVDTDVLIVDANLDVVAEALVYYEIYTAVDTNAFIARVLKEKKSLVVHERKQEDACLSCPAYNTCEIQSMIGVPIFDAGHIVGAIALLLPKHRTEVLFSSLDLVVKFTENIAEQISGKIKDRNAYNQARLTGIEKDAILDALEEGVAETGPSGLILYANSRFKKIFRLGETVTGQPLQVLLPHTYLAGIFEGSSPLGERAITIHLHERELVVIVSCKEIRSVAQPNKRFIFSFRLSQEVWLSARKASTGSLMTMQWCEKWLFTPQTIDRAKTLAVSGQSVLIVGSEADLNDSAAKAICNYSDRGGQGIVSVNCNNVSHELFDHYVLGRYGQLARADKATLIFYNVERLPLYMQEALTGFLKQGAVYLGNVRVQSDARLIFTTTADLEQAVAQGHFSEHLYYRLKANRLIVDSPLHDPARLETLLQTSLSHYKSVLQKPKLALSKHAMRYLLTRNWQSVREVNQFMESLADNHEGFLHQADVEALSNLFATARSNTTLEEVKKAEIEKLLLAGYKKTEIAEILGIGRATLYRKIKEYGLQ